jgi:hypothetical protein
MDCQRVNISTTSVSDLRGRGLHLVGQDEIARRLQHRNAAAAGNIVDLAHRRLAQAALGHIDDALEGEIVGGLADHAEKRHGVADFQPLVEARAADDAVVEPQRDEAFLELAHLERGAHQDRHVVEARPLICACSISSPMARASSSESQAAWTITRSCSGSDCSVNSVLPSRPSLWAIR